MDGIPVTFYAAEGVVNPALSYTVNGRATTHFTGSNLGVVTARVDDQILRIRVSAGGTPVAGTIPMQSTGVPINLLLTALLAIGGGLLLSVREIFLSGRK